jgi:predicted nucleotidyltransferase component of viral defense system
LNIADNSILTAEQKNLLLALTRSELRSSFYLTGGTCLAAFYLFHRLSEDLDLFSQEPVGIEPVLAFLKTLPDVVDIQYERKFDRKIFLLRQTNGRHLKVEFTTYPFQQCEKRMMVGEVAIDSLKDILVNKIMAITDRRDSKDFVDLYFGLKKSPELNLKHLLRATEAKFGIKGVSHIIKGRFLGEFPPLGALSMREDLDYEAIKEFFKKQSLSLISKELKQEP